MFYTDLETCTDRWYFGSACAWDLGEYACELMI